MTDVQIEMVMGDDLVIIQAHGALGEKLSQCRNVAQVIGIFYLMGDAIKALRYAEVFKPSGASHNAVWEKANEAIERTGMSSVMLHRLEITEVRVIPLTEAT